MSDFTPDPALDLVLERTIPVPPERVWDAWTQPELLMQWFTPIYQTDQNGFTKFDASGDPLPDDKAFRDGLSQLHSNPPPDPATGNPDPTWKDYKVLQYQRISGARPARYIDPSFAWW